MKKFFSMRCSCCGQFFFVSAIIIVSIIIEYYFGSYINLFHSDVIPDYLGVCIAINFGLTFDYVQNAMYSPLKGKIESRRNAAIAQLEDKRIEHAALDEEVY